MRRILFIVLLLACTSLQACRKDSDVIAEPITKVELNELTRVYKFKTSAVKRELSFSTPKDIKIC